uniref:Metastasis suppressor protein 1 n=1 Tax=Zonotrichia albicollis TaxID=44394 RepID=A0A8D2N8W3_ZONAL
MATNTRGGTREIGSALTRMCMRHRSIESKLRQFSSALIDCLINPLQEQMEEWKKVANQLDKDHAKEYKKARQEIKKKSSDTLKLQKKAKKAEALGRGDIQPQLDSALQDVNDKYLLLEETEKQAVRKALIEERGRFCAFISMLRPVIEEEISMLGEITHLQTISDDLKSLTMDPHKLPSSSEQNSSSSASSEASETCQSVSECSSPTSVSSGSTMGAWASTDKQGEEMEACEELALALSRGLQLDTQRSSRDSLQCSSGYSTQTTTPCCSEDTIPSQVSDYDYFSVSGDQEAEQQEFDKSSTIPRNSDISQSYRRMFQTKRPASTAGLPTTLGPVMATPGVATIRRTPSTKPSVRRGTIGGGPIPIKTPVIPVKTPTVPDIPGGLPGALAGTEECPEQGLESPAAGEGGQAVTGVPSWSGQAAVNPPAAAGQRAGAAEEQRQAVPEAEGEEGERDGLGSLAPAGPAELEPGELSPGDAPQGEDMLNAIRRGVKLKKTTTNDRSAPRIS